jgi:hypothetical protein
MRPPLPGASAGGESERARAVVEFEADERLGKHLLQVPGNDQAKTLHLFQLVSNDAEPDIELKKAAMRRLRETDPRIVTAVVTSHLGDSAPVVQLAMLDMIPLVYSKIGGVDATLDDVLVQRIRDGRPDVASKAIEVTSQLGIQAAYLPLREIAAGPASPQRSAAIAAMGRLRDPRAVIYFKKLLETEGAPKQDLYHGLAAIGRPAALLLKEKMNSSIPWIATWPATPSSRWPTATT